jgi:plasmid maintenance system antidote protein VapI
MKSVTDQLRDAIENCGLSQLQIAKAADVHQAALNRFVRRERGLTDRAIDKLCKYFGMRLTDPKIKAE